MSSLFVRGRSVYMQIKYAGAWKQIPTGIRTVNGKIPKEAFSAISKIDAASLLDRLDLRTERITIKALCEEYISSRIIAASTADAYRYACLLIVRLTGANYADELKRSCLGAIKTNSVYTKLRIIRHLHAVWEYALQRRYIRENMFHGIKQQRPPIRVRIYSPHDLHALFQACGSDFPDAGNQLMFLLLSGFRASESCALLWDDVNIAGGFIIHRNIKAHTETIYPIDSILSGALQSLQRTFSPFVFRYRDRFSLYRDFIKARAASGIDSRLTIHDLKRTYVTAVLRSTQNMELAKELSHHSAIATTMTYYKASEIIDEKRLVVSNARQKLLR